MNFKVPLAVKRQRSLKANSLELPQEDIFLIIEFNKLILSYVLY